MFYWFGLSSVILTVKTPRAQKHSKQFCVTTLAFIFELPWFCCSILLLKLRILLQNRFMKCEYVLAHQENFHLQNPKHACIL